MYYKIEIFDVMRRDSTPAAERPTIGESEARVTHNRGDTLERLKLRENLRGSGRHHTGGCELDGRASYRVGWSFVQVILTRCEPVGETSPNWIPDAPIYGRRSERGEGCGVFRFFYCVR